MRSFARNDYHLARLNGWPEATILLIVGGVIPFVQFNFIDLP